MHSITNTLTVQYTHVHTMLIHTHTMPPCSSPYREHRHGQALTVVMDIFSEVVYLLRMLVFLADHGSKSSASTFASS